MKKLMISEWVRWVLLALIVITSFGLVPLGIFALIAYVLPTIFVFMHGSRFLGKRNIVLFFVVIFVVTYVSEYLGVHTGKVFGEYYYNTMNNGPLLYGVPPLLMLTYFSMAYSTYMVVRTLLNKFEVIKGWMIVAISVLGGLLMTLADLASDPVNSTINRVYIWVDGGVFFGVPYMNFTGWFIETFIFFIAISLIFAYLTKSPKLSKLPSKKFTFEPIVLFAAPVLPVILHPLWAKDWSSVYEPMSLIALFGLGFVVVLATTVNFTRLSVKR